jgi:Fur family transcriptional regulator, ferric uptake regulator
MNHLNRLSSLLTSLRKSGHRIGRGRRAVLAALLDTEQPLSATDLYEQLRRNGSVIDKATVYRELHFLTDAGIARRVLLADAVARYEMVPERGHRHHFVCTQCKDVQSIDMPCEDLHAIEQRLGRENNVTIRDHALEFYGHCSRCT